ncbi:glycosyltransferase family 4 protein [Cobetia sp. MMG027]|uniref:glycosyltransferase family 4 protein n=1 Tax=Cobetia sp. MMG027 TaxID=3021980 RepID=UPI0022FE04A9|nr:glycosyltransferase family 4 protein [Cobetia sp. MMG027]MDA5563998.1 glycosyltransferase family 4 protein [Cobetia sp. MMG027]
MTSACEQAASQASSRPLHVRHVNLARGFRGGERQTLNLIADLARRASPGENGEPGTPIRQSLVCLQGSPLITELAALELAVTVDVIEIHGRFKGHLGQPRADIVHAHEAKAVHWAWLHQRLTGTPYLLTRRVPQPVKDKWFNRLTYRAAACRVAISSVIESHLRERQWGETALIPSTLAHLPSNETAVGRLRERFGNTPAGGRFVVGHVGALVDRHKGQRVLIEAARQLRDSHPQLLFVCLGAGEDEAAFKAESTDLDNLVWEGFHTNVGDYLEAFDLFAFPSRNEGLGSILLDVMDHGVPIIASEVDGIPDIVHDNATGVLVPTDDAQALASAIVALGDDAPRRERLVAGARAHLTRFTPSAMGEAYLGLYQRLAR